MEVLKSLSILGVFQVITANIKETPPVANRPQREVKLISLFLSSIAVCFLGAFAFYAYVRFGLLMHKTSIYVSLKTRAGHQNAHQLKDAQRQSLRGLQDLSVCVFGWKRERGD